MELTLELLRKEDRTEDEYRRACYGVANSKGMGNNHLFAEFMVKRFPNEICASYIEEWADRFMSGNPCAYMDSFSKEVYISLL